MVYRILSFGMTLIVLELLPFFFFKFLPLIFFFYTSKSSFKAPSRTQPFSSMDSQLGKDINSVFMSVIIRSKNTNFFCIFFFVDFRFLFILPDFSIVAVV